MLPFHLLTSLTYSLHLLLGGRDGRAPSPEEAEVGFSDESERELYLLAVERHDALGKPPDHICREAFVQVCGAGSTIGAPSYVYVTWLSPLCLRAGGAGARH